MLNANGDADAYIVFEWNLNILYVSYAEPDVKSNSFWKEKPN